MRRVERLRERRSHLGAPERDDRLLKAPAPVALFRRGPLVDLFLDHHQEGAGGGRRSETSCGAHAAFSAFSISARITGLRRE